MKVKILITRGTNPIAPFVARCNELDLLATGENANAARKRLLQMIRLSLAAAQHCPTEETIDTNDPIFVRESSLEN